MALGTAGVLVLAGCTGGSATDGDGDTTGRPDAGGDVFPASQVDPLVAALPQESVGPVPAMRLADGLVPPTNTWFSGLVFGDEPMPVFPFPISFQLTADGLAAGLPAPVASEKAVVAPARSDVTLDVGATATEVSAYDKVSVTVAHLDGGTVLGHTTVAEGSPLVSYTAATAQTDTLGAAVQTVGDGRGTLTVGDTTWGVAVTGGSLDGTAVRLDEGGSVVLVPMPDQATGDQVRTLLDAAASPLVSVTTAHRASGSGSTAVSTTELGYETAAGGDTLLVSAPHMGDSAADGGTGLSYETVYGTVPLSTGSALSFDAPVTTASAALDLSGLSDDEKDRLGDQVVADVAATEAPAADTYFGGKALYRSAMLLQLAEQLGDDASADTLRASLVDRLDTWTDPSGCTVRDQECFVYDPAVKGVVGKVASFGSDEFNDHYFHYGYFLYAAGVVAADDPELAERWRPVMDLLAADIASGADNQAFPDQRAFDPYWSHSWASGYSPFADGNNQESSSEAVNAYAGLSLWAAASGDDALAGQASWMLSSEASSALAYMLSPDLSAPQLAGYDHEIVSLTWGGKRDYGTWFSAEPSAIAGIQLIPLNPTSVSYLTSSAAGGAERIAAVVAEASASGFDTPLGDYVLMYSALQGPDAAAEALTALADLPETGIDDGNSRAYAMAYVMSAGAR
ncbi:glycosyl hydrolase [Frigoribacterium sp. PhB24]|uniref:glycosyl hydrolase n=1 Tax=Frigoribacterium sp. PhB24 TaxID=2485204 RepID=UPI000F47ED1C|nr:glycosyl hydrolase [Frigoribacterium sp. PhB24]ROS50306.1 endoglucanase Acf2 [Frigoribacterium sp. PhB24]